ncbi:MAG TPA: prephenate dehydrogenase/arogenate dehydrogenase family protein, partial [Bacteroidales bacterium]|nr:prephenate dehydrogenase/arogenate dehydrogenase family protein [Bacteroidales bacterium]
MVTGVVGLGLIGGSVAKAYKQAGHTVYGYDTDESVVSYAGLSGILEGELNNANIACCDMVHLAASPPASLDYLEQNAGRFSASCLVIDHCGTKRRICEKGFDLAATYGFTYVGGHPMAGT